MSPMKCDMLKHKQEYPRNSHDVLFVILKILCFHARNSRHKLNASHQVQQPEISNFRTSIFFFLPPFFLGQVKTPSFVSDTFFLPHYSFLHCYFPILLPTFSLHCHFLFPVSMGVPAFYRWLLDKYPRAVIPAEAELPISSHPTDSTSAPQPIDTSTPNPNGIEFDTLYLDMNSIIHNCSHPEDRVRNSQFAIRNSHSYPFSWCFTIGWFLTCPLVSSSLRFFVFVCCRTTIACSKDTERDV
jgi:hypothetical protein